MKKNAERRATTPRWLVDPEKNEGPGAIKAKNLWRHHRGSVLKAAGYDTEFRKRAAGKDGHPPARIIVTEAQYNNLTRNSEATSGHRRGRGPPK